MASFIEQARRLQIIEAAITVLAREGYAQASLSRIAAQAGISKSVISYHFSGKDEMFEAVYRHVEQSAGAHIGGFLEKETDPPGMIAGYIRNQIGYMAGHRDELLAIGHLAMSHSGKEGADYIAASARDEIELLEGLLAQGQQQGLFREFDRTVMAAVIANAIESALTEWAWRPDTDLSAFAEELVVLFARAMDKR